jgi:hypothetical protein
VELLGNGAALVGLAQKNSPGDAKADALPKPEPAVLTTRDAESQDHLEVLVRSGMFTKLDDAEMTLGKKSFRLRPLKVVERNSRAERVVFQVLKVK